MLKQKANGPHCSPDKWFQTINTFAKIYNYYFYERKKRYLTFANLKVVFEKNLKFCQCILTFFISILPWGLFI